MLAALKVLDSVHLEALLGILHYCGIPARLTGLLTTLYSGEWVLWSRERCVQFLFYEHRSEAGVQPCPTSFQNFYGLGITQSCGTVIVEYLLAISGSLTCFCLWLKSRYQFVGGSADGSQGTGQGGKGFGTSGVLRQNNVQVFGCLLDKIAHLAWAFRSQIFSHSLVTV